MIKQMKNFIIGGLVAVIVLGGLVYYFKGAETELAPVSQNGADIIEMPVEITTDNDSVPENMAVREFSVAASNFKFNTGEIRVKLGETVRIIFKNEVGVHDWRVDEFNAGTKVLQTGQEETIEFVADKTGAFEYYCSVGNHREMGMKGTLIVE